MYPCHSHMVVMAVMAFFTKIPKWQWHYDAALDSLYLTATSHVRLYIFFQRTFVVPIFSPLFDPTALFGGIPLYMAHSIAMPAHMAQPIVAPPSPPKSDPSEMSTSSSSFQLSGGYSPGDPKSMGVLENEFLFSYST